MNSLETTRLWSRFLNWIRLLGRFSHHRNVRRARRTLDRLRALASDNAPEPVILAYLRKIDPTVFEEMVLEVFEQKGYRVIRNRRYSGDGGLDGKIIINGRTLLVQCKRYTSHIDASHVRDFAHLCIREKQEGLFVHTGKTGKLSREIEKLNPHVKILSGFVLARVIVGSQILMSSNWNITARHDHQRKDLVQR